MIHTFPWIPPGVMGGKTISFWGVIKLDIQLVFQGSPFAPWNLGSAMNFFGWWKKLEEYYYYVHIWVVVINPTVRIYIPTITGWWQLNVFFHPECLGKMNPIWRSHIFRVGWLKPPTSHTMTPLLQWQMWVGWLDVIQTLCFFCERCFCFLWFYLPWDLGPSNGRVWTCIAGLGSSK